MYADVAPALITQIFCRLCWDRGWLGSFACFVLPGLCLCSSRRPVAGGWWSGHSGKFSLSLPVPALPRAIACTTTLLRAHGSTTAASSTLARIAEEPQRPSLAINSIGQPHARELLGLAPPRTVPREGARADAKVCPATNHGLLFWSLQLACHEEG